MLPRRRVGPVAGGAFAGSRTGQAHIEASTRRVEDVAGRPVGAVTTSVREIAPAHRLHVGSERPRQLGSWAQHGHSPNCDGVVRPRGLARPRSAGEDGDQRARRGSPVRAPGGRARTGEGADLRREPERLQLFDLVIAEAGELHPLSAQHERAPKGMAGREVERGRPLEDRGPGVLRGEGRGVTKEPVSWPSPSWLDVQRLQQPARAARWTSRP